MVEMAKYLTVRAGADADWSSGQVLAYLNQVVLSNRTVKELGEENVREMRTWAEVMDSLMAGNLPRVGDLAMQRFQALELAGQQGSWAQARHVEAIPDGDAALASTAVRQLAMRGEERAAKLRESLEKAKKRSGGE